jgi:N-acetylglucosaminyl-diphospho-decaprenol L-rhamnosyltransferase
MPLILPSIQQRISPRLTVIIVSYRSKQFLQQCLASVLRQLPGEIEVIVVDNASGDGTIEEIRADFPQVCLVANDANVGFPAANNQGIALARAAAILLLNPDTLVYPGALEALVECFDREPGDKIVGLNVRNADGTAQHTVHTAFPAAIGFVVEQAGFGTHNESSWDRDALDGPVPVDKPKRVAWVSGAAVSFNRGVLERVGVLDEGMFWAEDLDFCIRAAERGVPIYYLPSAKILHYGGESGKKNFRTMIYYQHLSRIVLAGKHYGTFYEGLLRVIYIFVLPAKIMLRSAQSLVPSRTRESRERIAGYLDALAFCLKPKPTIVGRES